MATPSSSNIAIPYLDLDLDLDLGTSAGSANARLLVGRRPASDRLAHALTASLPHAPPVIVVSAPPSSSNG